MKVLLGAIIAVAAFACHANAQNKYTPRANWQRISDCGVTFYVPPDVREEKARGIDSCVRRYRSESILIVLDSILYPDPGGSRREEYYEERDFNLRKTRVGGRKAEIITYFETKFPAEAQGLNYSAVLHVPLLPKGRGNFTLWTYSRNPESREAAIKIFESVRFAR